MLEQKLSYSETAWGFEINDHSRIPNWTRSNLNEGSGGLVAEQRNREGKERIRLAFKLEENLLAEVQRLCAKKECQVI